MKMYCNICREEQEIVASPSGPHVKACCAGCGRYFKILSKEEKRQMEKEEDEMFGSKVES